jgi:transcriptional regulator with XRE-family HTH domain
LALSYIQDSSIGNIIEGKFYKMKQAVNECFKKAMDSYGIQGKQLAELVGVSPQHISEFRTGKKWVSQELFESLLEAMDAISPGSRAYFCALLAGHSVSVRSNTNLIEAIENSNDDDIEAILSAIGRKWKRTQECEKLARLCQNGRIVR